MSPFYANVSPPARPLHHQFQSTSVAQYPSPAPHTLPVPHNHSSLAFDRMIGQRYADSNGRFRNAISRSSLNPESEHHCLRLVRYLRIHKHLFMHTYVHLVSCCQSRHLDWLVDNANRWKEWGSVQQLARHSMIRETLLSFGAGCTCHQHKSLFVQHSAISDDDSDLLSLLLYCGRESELYKLPSEPAISGRGGVLKESEEVIELLWKLLFKHQEESDVARRLRAYIYRMARKSAYLPHALQIKHSSISKEQSFGAGAHGIVTMAKMNGKDVIIKRILCDDRATQRKCLEMFASEAILWKTLQHKNIVPFLGVIAEGFGMGLVSPFFKNGNIKNRMKRYNPKDWPALARGWGRDLAEGLEYIHYHEPPIIHGDLKGDNVLVDDAGHARLGDFGQSHASDSGKYLDSTRVGLAAYSPWHWMAPEIMTGGERAKASDKSDIYSFGCVLYEMVSGKIPFEGLSVNDVLWRVPGGERPNRPESIRRDDPLWNVIQSCWKDSSKDRPSAARLVSLLH